MSQRMVAIWFPHLMTDRMLRRKPELKDLPFVMVADERNRRVVKAANSLAESKGLCRNMVLADCRALVPGLLVFEYQHAEVEKLLSALAEWCIRFSPLVALDLPDGLLLDAAGCTHLWGGEEGYLQNLKNRFSALGYHSQLAMADTIGCAWAQCHFGIPGTIVPAGEETRWLKDLPPAALRLDPAVTALFRKLGFTNIGSFMHLQRSALRRRFGAELLKRLDQALGAEMELPEPIRPVLPYQERLPSLEALRTPEAIGLALKSLLETLCVRLNRENKGLRQCTLKCYRVDGNIQQIHIGTSRPSRNPEHLFSLFGIRIAQLQPDLGFELFVLEAGSVEDLPGTQDALWSASSSRQAAFTELLDRLAGKTETRSIAHYLPAEHYWPERSVKESTEVNEAPLSAWRSDLPRPLHLLPVPEAIEAVVPIPDYPPMAFIYKSQRHTVKKADGPERIEQEWWLQTGLYRDYYCVEDETGSRYWLFRAGDNHLGDARWFLHGFFV